MDIKSVPRMLVYPFIIALGVFATQLVPPSNARSRIELDAGTWFIPANSSQLRFATLGYSTFLSSIAWVDVIFEYSGVLFENGSRRALGNLLRLVIFFDPRWQYPYEFAGLALETRNGVPSDQAVEILSDGVQRFPNSWRLRLYLAMAYVNRGESSMAIPVLEPLQTMSGEKLPEYVRGLAITLTERTEGPNAAAERLVRSFTIVSDPLVRASLQNKLRTMLDTCFVPLKKVPEGTVEGFTSMLESDPSQVSELILVVAGALRKEPRALEVLSDLARQWRLNRSP